MEIQREVLEYPAHAGGILPGKLLQGRHRTGTEWTLKIGELNNGDRGLCCSSDLRASNFNFLNSPLRNGDGRRCHLVRDTQRLVNSSLETFQGLRANNLCSVNKECRCTGDSQSFCYLYVGIDQWPVKVGFERLAEALHVQVQLAGILKQIGLAQLLLVGEEQIMHLPEFALRSCSQCSF